MTSSASVPDSFSDETPVADALEQTRPAVEPADPDFVEDHAAPLESNVSDWHEQRLVVEDPEDDFRR